MRRLAVSLALLVALAPALAAQVAAQGRADANRALVTKIYADLERGDLSGVLAVLDEHVVWIEDTPSGFAGRHVGPGTVATRVLSHLIAAGGTDVPESFSVDGRRVVVVGTTHRTDPATGHLAAVPFRHVWQMLDGRVVSVERSTY